MSAISWIQCLTGALSAFFALGFVINTFAVKKVGPEYERWGYPDWFQFVSGGLELLVALLLPETVTRPLGIALGGVIMFAAVAIVIYHREHPRAVPPFIVFVLLAILGSTML